MTERHPRIVADGGIPGISDALRPFGAVELVPGPDIRAHHVQSADILAVRSVTRVNEALLSGSSVRLVASATAGVDHVDVAWLAARGIRFEHAPGANATSVGDYVVAALLRLSVRSGRTLRGLTAGVIGCGQVGGRLVPRLEAFGIRVLKNDPPRVAQSGESGFVSLNMILAEADIVTSHVPLTVDGPYPTRHLISAGELARMKPGAWLLNTARGAVVNNRALGDALRRGHIVAALDVWEDEPIPDPGLVASVDISTPHIAGYAIDSKRAATRAVTRAVAGFLGVAVVSDVGPVEPSPLHLARETTEAAWLDAAASAMYPIERDDRMLRESMGLPDIDRAAVFDAMRRSYPERRLFKRYTIERGLVPAALREAAEEGLRITLI